MTKEYSSVASLRKPFKTPFKTTPKVPLKEAPQNVVGGDQQLNEVLELSDNDEVVVIEENVYQQDDREAVVDLSGVCSCRFLLPHELGLH